LVISTCLFATVKSGRGKDCDDLTETKDGTIQGPGVAKLLENHPDDSCEAVDLDERTDLEDTDEIPSGTN
jgi:hypothetical protein